MVGESLAIIALIVVMATMFAKSGRRAFAAVSLPLVAIPALHLLGAVLRMYGALPYFDIAGLLVGAVLCAFFSRAFSSKRGRLTYLVFCVAFLVILFIAYQINL